MRHREAACAALRAAVAAEHARHFRPDHGDTWTRQGIALDISAYGYPGAFVMKDQSIMVSYCESSKSPNRVYVMRFRVNRARDGIRFLPLATAPRCAVGTGITWPVSVSSTARYLGRRRPATCHPS